MLALLPAANRAVRDRAASVRAQLLAATEVGHRLVVKSQEGVCDLHDDRLLPPLRLVLAETELVDSSMMARPS